MFERFKGLFRRAVKSIAGTQDLFDALNIEVPVSQKMQDAIQLWIDMHEDKPEPGVKSMNLFAGVVTAVSQSVTIEMKSEITGSPRADYMNDIYQKLLKDKQNITEFACARGDYILKPSVTPSGMIIDQIKAGNYWPLAFDTSGYCTEALFLDRRLKENRVYIRGEIQRLRNEILTIENRVIVAELYGNGNSLSFKKASLADVDEWAQLKPVTQIKNVYDVPWGQFKMPISNVVDSDSPMGVSFLSRAINLLKDANQIYDQLMWEFRSGERKVFADSTTFPKDREGRPILPDDRYYEILNIQKGDGSVLFEQLTPELRERSYISTLNLLFDQIDFVCGLSKGFTSSVFQEVARTATEIKILKQRSYVTIDSIQQAFERALEHLIKAMDFWVTVYSIAPPGDYEVTFDWDNSIIEDEEQQRAFDIQLCREGKMPWSIFLQKYYKLTDQQAIEWLSIAEQEQRNFDSTMPGEE